MEDLPYFHILYKVYNYSLSGVHIPLDGRWGVLSYISYIQYATAMRY